MKYPDGTGLHEAPRRCRTRSVAVERTDQVVHLVAHRLRRFDHGRIAEPRGPYRSGQLQVIDGGLERCGVSSAKSGGHRRHLGRDSIPAVLRQPPPQGVAYDVDRVRPQLRTDSAPRASPCCVHHGGRL